jgi:acyl-CoA-binding protein
LIPSIWLIESNVTMSDRVFGHALNTVNKIRPGSTKPPASDRLALYGLYKQSMEGDVSLLSSRPASSAAPYASLSPDSLAKEQEKWDAWKSNEGLSRTESKRRYIEKLISTMHEYASGTDEARQLVEELEFVWDQVKSNSLSSGDSERSSPLHALERSGYISSSGGNGGVDSTTVAMEGRGGREGGQLRVLSPVSQADEDEEAMDEQEEFVDARVSQVDGGDLGDLADIGAGDGAQDASYAIMPNAVRSSPADMRWRKRIESSLIKLTTEVTALREQLESRRFFARQRKYSLVGWVLRLSWWAVQLFAADVVILWLVILYLRRKQDRRLEMAVRVLLGDAVAQVQKVSRDVKLPKLPGRRGGG